MISNSPSFSRMWTKDWQINPYERYFLKDKTCRVKSVTMKDGMVGGGEVRLGRLYPSSPNYCLWEHVSSTLFHCEVQPAFEPVTLTSAIKTNVLRSEIGAVLTTDDISWYKHSFFVSKLLQYPGNRLDRFKNWVQKNVKSIDVDVCSYVSR